MIYTPRRELRKRATARLNSEILSSCCVVVLRGTNNERCKKEWLELAPFSHCPPITDHQFRRMRVCAKQYLVPESNRATFLTASFNIKEAHLFHATILIERQVTLM